MPSTRYWTAVTLILAVPLAVEAQDGALQIVRDDVRQGPPAAPAAPPREDDSRREKSPGDEEPEPWLNGIDGDTFVVLPYLAFLAASSPLWAPQALLQDHFPDRGYFLRYPYDHGPGYLKTCEGYPRARPWAVRVDLEYMETFDDVESLGGHLLLSTASRLGLDVSAGRLQERLPGGECDELRLGDCNLIYRFAQADWAEFRAGLGANWLDDACRTDLGFNFTYAADFFPKKPWVLSTAIDWGTLGDAGLFRFRATAGCALRGIEIYTGYEYTDIARTEWNGLIGGVRLWF